MLIHRLVSRKARLQSALPDHQPALRSGSIILTTNKAFKDWSEIFSNDSAITSAVLDRLLHHCDTVVIKGSSYRIRKPKK